MRRRAILLMATIGAAMLLACGVAIAETVTCDSTPPCYGTPETDDMTGTASGETIYAYGGNDSVYAGGGNDTIYGGPGDDGYLVGEGGNDKLYGGGGGDEIDASFRDSAGSTDYSYGQGGNDEIYADDGNPDIIDCGKGTDRVRYDQALDTVKGCEIRFPT